MNLKPEPGAAPLPRQRTTGGPATRGPVALRRHDVVRARPATPSETVRFDLAPGEWVFEIHRAGTAHPLVYPTTAVLHYPGGDSGRA